jgi:hypothetical protein
MNYMNRVLRTQYTGFFDDLELDEMMKGVDYWLDADSFLERWNRRNEYFQALIDEAIEEASEDPCDTCGEDPCSCNFGGTD